MKIVGIKETSDSTEFQLEIENEIGKLGYARYSPKTETISFDGIFTAEELKAILKYMDENK